MKGLDQLRLYFHRRLVPVIASFHSLPVHSFFLIPDGILPEGGKDIAGGLHIACTEKGQRDHPLHILAALHPILLCLLAVVVDGREYVPRQSIIAEETPHI